MTPAALKTPECELAVYARAAVLLAALDYIGRFGEKGL